MPVLLHYNVLFQVDVIHHYFLDDGNTNYENMNADQKAGMQKKYSVQNFMQISPSDNTLTAIKGHQCVFRATDTGILVGCSKDLNNTSGDFPVAKPSDSQLFRFNLEITDPDFINYTALPLSVSPGYCFYFSNDSFINKHVAPSLSAQASVFTAGNYNPGDMLVDNETEPGEVFLALKKTNQEPKPATIAAKLWKQDILVSGKPLSYVNNNCLVRAFQNLFFYTIPEAGKEPSMTLTSREGITFEVKSFITPGDKNMIKADLGMLEEGLYKATLKTPDLSYQEELLFYHFKKTISWGVIEIISKSDDAKYNLFKTDGSFKNPVFQIRFKNRLTFWRYKGPQFNDLSVTEALPLTSSGFLEISVNDKANHPVNNLPNPSSRMIIPETEQYYSEVFIP